MKNNCLYLFNIRKTVSWLCLCFYEKQNLFTLLKEKNGHYFSPFLQKSGSFLSLFEFLGELYIFRVYIFA